MALPLLLAGALGIGAGANLIASNKATKGMASANDANLAQAARDREDNIARFLPWYNAGTNALAAVQGSLGQTYEMSPFAKYALEGGMDQMGSTAAARGDLFSGSSAVNLDKYRMGFMAQDRDNWYNKQLSLANGGQAAAGFQSNISQNAGAQMSQSRTGTANALATNYMNTGNIINQGIGNLVGLGAYMKGAG